MRRVFLVDAADRIAAQRYDVAHAGRAIVADHGVDLGAGGGDAGEMRGRGERSLAKDALDGCVGALAGRTAGAVGHRHEIGFERREPGDGFPKGLFHLLGLRREELGGDADAALGAGAHEAAGARLGIHQATSRSGATAAGAAAADGSAIARRVSRPSQSETAILPSEAGSGASVCCRTRSRPAAFSHWLTVSAANPRRRWACASRRNSRSWGAKSMTSSRPPGRSTRAASAIARPPSSRKCRTW